MSDHEDEHDQTHGTEERCVAASNATTRIKLPAFWEGHPRLWFAQAEAQFDLYRITSDYRKYLHIIANLDISVAKEVEDIISDPPIKDKYETLKREIIKRLSLSEEKRIRQLLSNEELGDRTPSQFLRHLKSLIGDLNITDDLLRTIWSQRLPNNIQVLLQCHQDMNVTKLAELADNVYDILSSSSKDLTLASVTDNVHSEISNLTNMVKQLKTQIDDLTTEIHKIKESKTTKFRRRSITPHKNSNSDKEQSLCYYHKTYGDKAHRCRPPCEFVENS